MPTRSASTWSHADAFGYLRQMGLNGKSYGVIVLDPPKLIVDRDEVAPGKRKYFDLNVMAMKLVEPGGVLVTCSCSGLLPPEEFLALRPCRGSEGGAPGPDPGLWRQAAADHPVAASTPPKGLTSRLPGSVIGDPAAG